MRAKVIFCDICKDKIIGNDGDVRMKYKAKMRWWLWYEGGWKKIDICASCLNKIILAKEEKEDEQEKL